MASRILYALIMLLALAWILGGLRLDNNQAVLILLLLLVLALVASAPRLRRTYSGRRRTARRR